MRNLRSVERKVSRKPEPGLSKLSRLLKRNFPDFYAEARFQLGDDDQFLYARFGQYLARSIESERALKQKINKAFQVLNKMAEASNDDPYVRTLFVSGPLEAIIDAPRALARAREELSPTAQAYLDGLKE
jgi:hypothetical protein